VPASLAAWAFNDAAGKHEEMAQLNRKSEQDRRREAGTERYPSVRDLLMRQASEYASDAQKREEQARRLRSLQSAVRSDLDASELFRSLSSPEDSVPGSFSLAMKRGAVAEVSTGVDGGFTFNDVPAGSYYLHSVLSTSVLRVEWFIPVSLAPGGSKVDLHNGTSLYVKNLTPPK
jgi:hypothetical protein